MIAGPHPNLTSRPYRGLSVQDVAVDLDPASLLDWITGREVYRRTDYLLARRDGQAALLAIEKGPGAGLFLPVEAARVLAGIDEVVLIDRPQTDVGNATALAEVACAHRAPGARAYIITGRYRHVNFIVDPEPVTVYVDEVVPPHPAKLVDMARQAVQFDENLPPVRIVSRLISLPMLMRRAGAHHLLPCRGAGDGTRDDVSYLDAGPDLRPGWTLIGCERSRQIYRHHYGDDPRAIDFCPASTGPAQWPGMPPRLTKCCLLERGIRGSGNVATVPWGANLDEVRAALTVLLRESRSADA
jgi:hypothetical protein